MTVADIVNDGAVSPLLRVRQLDETHWEVFEPETTDGRPHKRVAVCLSKELAFVTAGNAKLLHMLNYFFESAWSFYGEFTSIFESIERGINDA